MSEPDWEAIRANHNPVLDALKAMDLGGLHAALMVIGWRLGVVAAEDLEIHLLECHDADPAGKKQADLRLYNRIIQRLREQLEGA